MKTTIEMPDEIFQAAKAAALMRGQTLKQLVTAAVERELKGMSSGVTAEPQPARAKAFRAKLEKLARQNALAWQSEKSALQQLQGDRSARCH